MKEVEMSLNPDFTTVLKDTLASLKRAVSAPARVQRRTGSTDKSDQNSGLSGRTGFAGKILQGIKGKEETITAAVFRQWLQPVKENLYNFIYKALNYSEDADDLFQDTVMRALKYINSFDRGGSFKTWIFTIAHNEIKSYYKKKKGVTAVLAPALHREEELAEEITADEKTVEKQLIADIYEIAAGLKPRQRKVFFLFYDSGFSIGEISRITGLKEGNIKFILNQARERIKADLGPGARGAKVGQSLKAKNSSLNKSFLGVQGAILQKSPLVAKRLRGWVRRTPAGGKKESENETKK